MFLRDTRSWTTVLCKLLSVSLSFTFLLSSWSVFYTQSVVHILYLVRVLYSVRSPYFIPSPCFIPSPQSVVRSPQSVFYTDRKQSGEWCLTQPCHFLTTCIFYKAFTAGRFADAPKQISVCTGKSCHFDSSRGVIFTRTYLLRSL